MRAVAALLVFLACAGCANTATSPAPSSQTGSVNPPAATWTVSGTVWVAGVFGVEVATRGTAFGWVESGAPGDPVTGGVVRDYIAGMTDRFALSEYDRIFHKEIALSVP